MVIDRVLSAVHGQSFLKFKLTRSLDVGSLQEEEGQQSLECIQANQIFPKKSPVLEEENMQVSKLEHFLMIWGGKQQ